MGATTSSYDFDAAATPIDDAASPFYVGDFTHNNNPIYPPSLTSADLMVTITGDIDGTAFSLTSTFTFAHNETTNDRRPATRPVQQFVPTSSRSSTARTCRKSSLSMGLNIRSC